MDEFDLRANKRQLKSESIDSMSNILVLQLKLAQPAQRALANAGIISLKHLSKFSENEISQLHGIGNNAMQILKEALKENELSFARK